jgi:transcriptional regulator with XRE-family HTH domain
VSALSDAIKVAIRDARKTYLAVATELAGEGIVTTKDTVNLWANGRQRPLPEEVFAIERVLNVPAGSLSSVDGYIPVDMKPARSVLDAIEADHRLPPEIKNVLRASYRAGVKGR